MSNRKKILILKFSNISNQPRICRQIEFLKDYYDIYTAGFKGVDTPHIKKHFKIKIPFLPFGLCEKLLWNVNAVSRLLSDFYSLDQPGYDLIIAHDPFTLQVALQLSQKMKAKVLHNAHEYTPRQYEHQWFHRFFLSRLWDYICRIYMHRADATVTVCQGIADEYEKNYGVHCEIIDNAPFYYDLLPSSTENNVIRMIHHGIAHPSRHTEDMIHLMHFLDERFTLDFMLMNNGSRYYKKILDLGQGNPRIFFRDTVSMPLIAQRLNEYDMGLYMLKPSSFNTYMALPNKIFEFIQARLAIAIWPSPEMANIVNEYDCGIVSEDFTIESMAKQLNSLSTKDIEKFKMNSHKAAGYLCAEKNKDILLNIVEKLLR
jgi:glycosyltransferase involved in cell wall biosynthesis